MDDHKMRAEQLLAEAVQSVTGSDVESSRQVQALVHATLFLAEQQRIANELRATELFVDKPWLRAEIERLGLS